MLINPFWYAPKSAPIVVSPGDISGGPFPPPPVTVPAGHVDVVEAIKSIDATTRGYKGAVVMINGQVMLAPTSGSPLIFDPATNTTRILTAPFTPHWWLDGACLLKDGQLYMAARSEASPSLLYDCKADTVRLLHPGKSSSGCILLNDGRVLNVSASSLKELWVHDVSTDTASVVATLEPNVHYSRLASLLDDTVFIAPYTAGKKMFLYHPSTNSIEEIPNTLGTNGAILDTVLTAQGKVFCVPEGSHAIVFDPTTKSFDTHLTVQPRTRHYLGGCMLADRKIFISPGQVGGHYGTVSADCNAFDGPHQYSGSQYFALPCLLFDGRVLVPSGRDGTITLIGNRLPTQLPASLILSNRYNRV
jgi:hypothetical protein